MRHVRRYGHFLLLVQWQAAGVERHICHPLYHFFFATSLCIDLFLDYETYSGTFSSVHELFASS